MCIVVGWPWFLSSLSVSNFYCLAVCIVVYWPVNFCCMARCFCCLAVSKGVVWPCVMLLFYHVYCCWLAVCIVGWLCIVVGLTCEILLLGRVY